MTAVDKIMIAKIKERNGQTFSNLNLTSSAKINKKKTSGANITTTKELSKIKDGSKFETELKILVIDFSSNILIDSEIFCSYIRSEIILNGSAKNVVCITFESIEIKSSDCC